MTGKSTDFKGCIQLPYLSYCGYRRVSELEKNQTQFTPGNLVEHGSVLNIFGGVDIEGKAFFENIENYDEGTTFPRSDEFVHVFKIMRDSASYEALHYQREFLLDLIPDIALPETTRNIESCREKCRREYRRKMVVAADSEGLFKFPKESAAAK